MAGRGGGQSRPVKNQKKTKMKQEEDDEDWLDDLVVDTDKRQMSYSNLEPGGFMTKGADRKSRLDQRHARIVAAAGEPDDDDDEEDKMEQERLEREANELSSQPKKAERAEAQACDKDERDKAKRYSTHISEGHYLKQPKAVTLVQTKKRKKSMKMENIRSADEEDKADNIPEGFHLHEQSPHGINMKRAEDYQAYLRQIVLDFEHIIKSGATNIRENYGKVIQNMFWAVKVNKQMILNGADPDEVLASILDLKCKAWRMKLNGKMTVDPGTLVDDTDIGPQTAS